MEQWKEGFLRKVRERYPRYLRLGFTGRFLFKELIEDDELWETAKNLPIDPNNDIDRINKSNDPEELLALLQKHFGKKS